jgi:hypothetical protein
VAKSSPKMLAISVIFTKLPKADKSALGENSPNLVTLVSNVDFFAYFLSLLLRCKKVA